MSACAKRKGQISVLPIATAAHRHRGSVDDGKSTLDRAVAVRLKAIFEDQSNTWKWRCLPLSVLPRWQAWKTAVSRRRK